MGYCCLSTGRLVWINFEGIPLVARNHKSIFTIASSFRDVLEVIKFDFNLESLQPGKALICLQNLNEIKCVLKSSLNGHFVDVKVFEDRFSLSLLLKSHCEEANKWVSDSQFSFDKDKPCVDDTFGGAVMCDRPVGQRSEGLEKEEPLTVHSPNNVGPDIDASMLLLLIPDPVGSYEPITNPTFPLDNNDNTEVNNSNDDNDKEQARLLARCCEVRDLGAKDKPLFLSIQETKLNLMDISLVQSLWSRSNVSFVHGGSDGASGGLLTLWDVDVFVLEDQVFNQNFYVPLGLVLGFLRRCGEERAETHFNPREVAFDDLRDELSVMFGLSELKITVSFWMRTIEGPIKDQPYHADALHTDLSPGTLLNPIRERGKEGPEEMILSPQAENTEAFETDKSASTPPTSPHHIILSFETKSRTVRMSIHTYSTQETMTTVDQGMSVEEIKRVDASEWLMLRGYCHLWRVTNMACKVNKPDELQECKVAIMLTTKTSGKVNHNGKCIYKGRDCKKVGHITRECRNPTAARNQRTHTCYECGSLRHFKNLPMAILLKTQETLGQVRMEIAMNVGIKGTYRRGGFARAKNQSHKNQIGGTGAHGVVHTLREGETNQDPNNIKDEIKA
ncbi:hypothetical protein Tco_0218232 [Tanacetum coccineum]